MYAAIIVVGLVLCTLAYFDPRNRLAFRIEVSDGELARLHKRLSNATAIRSLVYGALSLGVPFLGLFSLSLGLVAWRRADRNAWPPIGGRGVALAGVAVSCTGLVMWTALAIVFCMRR
jgi:tetrahydromethanopterin S-methyltransferase subunit C